MTEKQALVKARKLARLNDATYVVYLDMDDYTDAWRWYVCRDSLFGVTEGYYAERAYEVEPND